jgi:hypothetical protein
MQGEGRGRCWGNAWTLWDTVRRYRPLIGAFRLSVESASVKARCLLYLWFWAGSGGGETETNVSLPRTRDEEGPSAMVRLDHCASKATALSSGSGRRLILLRPGPISESRIVLNCSTVSPRAWARLRGIESSQSGRNFSRWIFRMFSVSGIHHESL